MVATADSRLNLTTNGTFLSDLYPRPATADAWKAVPVQHPAVAKKLAPKPQKLDPDCLNLGCQSIETNASWVRSAQDAEERTNKHDSTLASVMAFAPSILPEAVVNMTSSVIQSSSSWLSAAGKAAVSLSGFGGGAANSSSMYLGSTLSLAPVSAVATDLVLTLRQVVNVANGLLATLAGGLPAQPMPMMDTAAASTTSVGTAGLAPAAAAAKPPVAAEKAKATK